MCQSLCSPSLLTENQLLRLEAVKTLCEWTRYDLKTPVKLKSEIDVKYVKTKIVSLLEEDVFEPNRAIDVIMVRKINKENKHKSNKNITCCMPPEE